MQFSVINNKGLFEQRFSYSIFNFKNLNLSLAMGQPGIDEAFCARELGAYIQTWLSFQPGASGRHSICALLRENAQNPTKQNPRQIYHPGSTLELTYIKGTAANNRPSRWFINPQSRLRSPVFE